MLKFLVDDFTWQEADVEEVAPRSLEVGEAVEIIARKKALWMSQRHKDAWVLAADTVVVWGTDLVGKARSESELRERLALLSGSTHQVWTGLSLAWNGQIMDGARAVAAVHMAKLPKDVVDTYAASQQWEGKAGGYGIQDALLAPYLALQSGPWSNVVGLPLAVTCDLLRRNNLPCKEPPAEAWLRDHNPFVAASGSPA